MNYLLCFYFINTDQNNQNKPNTYMMEYHVTEKHANKDNWMTIKMFTMWRSPPHAKGGDTTSYIQPGVFFSS